MAEHGHIVEGVHYVIHDPFSKIAITDPSKLLGRDKELLDLKNFLASGEDSLLIVKGKRQVGKSSLLKSFLAMTVSDDKRDDLKLPFKVIPIYLSMDNIMNMEMMKTTLGVSVESTFSEVITFVKKPKHVKKFQKVLSFLEGSEKHYSFPFNIPFLPVTAGLEIGGKGHELFMKAGLRGMIDAIGLSAENCDKSVALIVLDEVQQATRWKLEEKTEFLSILKHVQDNKRNVKVILTGSDIRLMNQLLDKEFMDIMYNRAIGNLTLYPFDRDQSKTFLESGFRRGKLSIPAEIEN
ncbi:MAG: hypothetical protein M1163_05805 [Candidatus Thermoplasmatota archaeon]|nr:hypothetical protein [Candidatus Thermoplasmatota archaeon]